MIRFPGFIDICTNIPAGKWDTVSRTAVRSGYTSLIASPLSEEIFTEKPDVIRAMAEPDTDAVCDYAKMALITPENIRTIEDWSAEVPAALIDFSLFESAGSFAQMNMLSRLFNRWPAEKPICVRGNENQIGSAVFMGQVHRRKVHICSVTTRAEIELVNEAKQAGLPVTCDIHPLSLLFSSETPNYPGFLKKIGTEDDRQALWSHFSEIDCFSSAGFADPRGDETTALSMMLPLLLSMRNSKMLTEEDIIRRCCVNPMRLFGIRPDPTTVVEAEGSDGVSGTGPFIRSVKLRGTIVYSAEDPAASPSVRSVRIKGYSV